MTVSSSSLNLEKLLQTPFVQKKSLYLRGQTLAMDVSIFPYRKFDTEKRPFQHEFDVSYTRGMGMYLRVALSKNLLSHFFMLLLSHLFG